MNLLLPYRTSYVLLKSGAMPYWVGGIGEGKSDAAVSMATNWLNIDPKNIYTMFLAQNDPILLGTGIPTMNVGTGTFSLSSWDVVVNILTQKDALLFADELPDGDVDQQRAFSPIALLRKIAGVPIECYIIAAGNRVRDGANELDERLGNRMAWLEWDMSSEEFVRGLREGWDAVMGKAPSVPDNWVDLIPEKKALWANYIEEHPAQFKSKDAMTSEFRTFASARSIEKFAVRFLACAEAALLSKKDTQLGLEGCVGRGVGASFMLWNRHGGINVKALVDDVSKLNDYIGADASTVDSIFEAVNAYTAEGSVEGVDCGAFYTAALKYGFPVDVVLRWARKVSKKLPPNVRDSVFAEIAVRTGQTIDQ